LVKALKAQHPDVRIFAVGDDWQSIFRFAGSDIHLMRHFGEEFGGSFNGEAGVHRVVDLGRTFRSVDQIAFAAKTFVLKNPAQIEKKIVPAGSATEPAIRVVMVGKEEEALAELSTRIMHADQSSSVLILGRYRFLEPNKAALRTKLSAASRGRSPDGCRRRAVRMGRRCCTDPCRGWPRPRGGRDPGERVGRRYVDRRPAANGTGLILQVGPVASRRACSVMMRVGATRHLTKKLSIESNLRGSLVIVKLFETNG
jgi:hypothetical protein